MPGRSESGAETTPTAFDQLAQLTAAGSLSRRQVLARAFGLAAVAMLPSWVPFAQAKRAAAILNAQTSISDVGKCPPRARGRCDSSYADVGPWTPACKSAVPNNFRPEFNGCGPAKWGKLPSLLRALARAADRPALLTSFTEGCNEHDCCYGTCGSSKAVCDDRFRAGLIEACKRTAKDLSPLGTVLSLTYEAYCLTLADSFYLVVAETGQGKDAFHDAQKEVCVCCEGEQETGPCGGKTCNPGELCCQGRTCYDPQCFACCNIASHPGELVSIFLSPGGDPASVVAFCVLCGQGGVSYAHSSEETCESILERYPGCECAGPFAAVSGRFDYCESRPPR